MIRAKNIVMTGATSGFGVEYVKQLMKIIPNATIYLFARDESKFEALQEFASDSGSMRFVYCNLLNIESILSAIDEVLKHTKSIDLLIHNAGLFPSKSKQGILLGEQKVEHALMVNHLAPMIMTLLFAPALKQSPNGRVVCTSSFQHANGNLNNFDFMFEKSKYSAMTAYQNSKLYNLVAFGHLASSFSTSFDCYAFDPGIVDTQMTQQAMPLGVRFLYPALRYFFRDIAKGAETGVYLSTQPLNTHKTKFYFRDKEPIKPHSSVGANKLAKHLFEASFVLIKEALPASSQHVIYELILDLQA